MPSSQMQQHPNNPGSNPGAPGAQMSAMGSPASVMGSVNPNLPPGTSPVNANAPITHLNFPICASCRQDILEGDDRLDCFSGCVNNSYHRMCAGLSKVAYDLFMQEENVEWACDICVSTRQVPLIKTRPMPPAHMEGIPGGNNPGGPSNFAPFSISQQNMSMKNSTVIAN